MPLHDAGMVVRSACAVAVLFAGALLVRNGPSQHFYPVTFYCADDQITPELDLWLTQLLWLAMDLAAMADTHIGRQHQIRRIPSYPVTQPRAKHHVCLAIGS